MPIQSKKNKINFEAKAEGQHLELSFYDAIGGDGMGGGITAKMVSQALKANDAGSVTAYINSPGGSAFEGIAIYNVLRNHPGKVTTVVQGIAASAASLIAMAGDEVHMNESAMLMMHDASGLTYGNAADHKKQMETLDKLDGSIATIYANKTGGDAATIRELMDEETWMNADEALADGYADAVIVATVPDNHFDLSTFTNVPKEIADRFGKRDTHTQPEPEHDNMTPEQFKAKHKDVVDGWLNDEAAETYANAKNDAKAMLEACGGDKAAALDAWLEGKSIEDARNARTQTIEEQLAETQAKLEAAEARAKELENGADPVTVNPDASVAKDKAEDATDPKTLAVFKAAKRMKNEMGRNAYLSDRGIEPQQYTDWLEANG